MAISKMKGSLLKVVNRQFYFNNQSMKLNFIIPDLIQLTWSLPDRFIIELFFFNLFLSRPKSLHLHGGYIYHSICIDNSFNKRTIDKYSHLIYKYQWCYSCRDYQWIGQFFAILVDMIVFIEVVIKTTISKFGSILSFYFLSSKSEL